MTIRNDRKIFLLADGCRCLTGTYQPDETVRNGTAKRELFKTFDPAIGVGDIVTVESENRWGVTTVKIVEADVPVDYTSSEPIRWIIHRVDMSVFHQLKHQEKAIFEQIAEREAERAREQARKDLMESMGGKMPHIAIPGPGGGAATGTASDGSDPSPSKRW